MVLVGIELTFFTVANVRLRFGFVLETADNTGMFSFCRAGLTQGQGPFQPNPFYDSLIQTPNKTSGQIPSLGWPVLEVSSKLITPASFWKRLHIRSHLLYIYLSSEPPPQMPEKKLFSKAVFSFPRGKFIRAPTAACKSKSCRFRRTQ